MRRRHLPLFFQLLANGRARRMRLLSQSNRSWMCWSGKNKVLRFIPRDSVAQPPYKAKRK